MKKKQTRDPTELVLPDEMNEPSDRLEDYLVFLFGEKKIGKTAMSSRFEDSLHIMSESGGKAQRSYQIPVGSWAEFKGVVKLLRKTDRFRHLSLDIVDNLYKMCQKHICMERGITHPSD